MDNDKDYENDIRIFIAGFSLAAVFFLLWKILQGGSFSINLQMLLVSVLHGQFQRLMHLLIKKGNGWKTVACIFEVMLIVFCIGWLLFVALFRLQG